MYKPPEALTEQFGQILADIGIPVWRLNVGIKTLHPQLASRIYRWLRDDDGTHEYGMPPRHAVATRLSE